MSSSPSQYQVRRYMYICAGRHSQKICNIFFPAYKYRIFLNISLPHSLSYSTFNSVPCRLLRKYDIPLLSQLFRSLAAALCWGRGKNKKVRV